MGVEDFEAVVVEGVDPFLGSSGDSIFNCQAF